MFPKTTYWILVFCLQNIVWANAIIVDHTCTDLTQIPQSAIEHAKASLHIAYGHTSHGSQLTYGMEGLVAFANGGGLGLSLPTNIFAWNNGGIDGALDLHDYAMAGDVGSYPYWINETIAYLDNSLYSDVNVIIWSWCGEASGFTEQNMIDYYLSPMTQLELTYPNVKFVYMTGHLDGTGENGNLNRRNQQIRDYCIANNKTLYDFADIESYDPDAFVNYMLMNCNDACQYDPDGDDILDRNWALEWQASHVQGVDWYECGSIHTFPLSANMKAYAAWWLWARLAGWSGLDCPDESPSDFNHDCKVDFADMALLSSNWETSVPVYDIAPENGDGIIDINDLSEFTSCWLQGDYIAADLNKDRKVNLEDITRLSQSWQTADPLCDIAPNGGDGVVDLNDLLEVAANWLYGSQF